MRRGIKEGIININLAFRVLALFLSLSQWLLNLKVLSISSVKASAAYLFEAAACFNGYTFTSLLRTINLQTVAPSNLISSGVCILTFPFCLRKASKTGHISWRFLQRDGKMNSLSTTLGKIRSGRRRNFIKSPRIADNLSEPRKRNQSEMTPGEKRRKGPFSAPLSLLLL